MLELGSRGQFFKSLPRDHAEKNWEVQHQHDHATERSLQVRQPHRPNPGLEEQGLIVIDLQGRAGYCEACGIGTNHVHKRIGAVGT